MEAKQNSKILSRGNILRALLLAYDVVMVNLAYYVAVLMRFSDADSFRRSGVKFMVKFVKFAPWYTIACIVIFILFHLYSGVWRYAGFNDFKKLAIVNVCTCVFYVCGSLIIVGRMPITVYSIGAVLQFFMMCLARLAPRYIFDSYGKSKSGRKGEVAIPLMIVGIGENARIIQSKIDRDRTNIVKPVCVIDHGYGLSGKTFNGLPVYAGIEGLKDCIGKYDIRCAIIADNSLPADFIAGVRDICDERNIEMRDFMIGTEYRSGRVGIRALLDACDGPVLIERAGQADERFETGREALRSLSENVNVDKVGIKGDAILIRAGGKQETPGTAGEEWVEKYREETGSDVSFF